jgi:hypothetical protein
MRNYTVEVTYLVPVYKHVTVKANSAEGAAKAALADDCWDGGKTDWDNCRPEFITGIWLGKDAAYSGIELGVPEEFAKVPE